LENLRPGVRLLMIVQNPKRRALAMPAVFIVTLIILGQTLAAVAQAASLGVTIEKVDASSFPTVSIYGSVANDQGVPITGLDQSSFSVLEDDKAVEQFQVRSTIDNEPVAATLLVDVSSTMAGSKLDATKQAANAFVDKMGSRDTTMVIAFNDQAKVIQDFTGDKTKLKAAIAGLSATGGRAAYSGITAAASQQASAQAARRAIILITDGSDNASKISMGDAIKAANDSKTPVFTVGVGSDVNKSVLDTIANSTSAQPIYVSAPDGISQIFRNLSDQLHTQYIFTYTSKLAPDNQQHNVSIDAKYNGAESKITATFVAKSPALAFTVSGITDKSTVSGSQSIAVNVTAGTAKQAQLLIDGQPVATASSAPFTLNWDASKLTAGQHAVVVQVTDAAGTQSEKSYTVQAAAAAAPTPAPTVPPPTAAATVSAAPTAVPTPAGNSNQGIIYAAAGAGVVLLIGAGAAAFALSRRKPVAPPPVVVPPPVVKPVRALEDRTEVIARPAPPPPVQRVEATAVVDAGQTMMGSPDAGATVVPLAPQPRARLHIVQAGTESDANLTQAETILGRDPTNPIVVRDPMSSRRHARIIIENGEFWLEDMKSLNGTRVNGEAITGRRKLLPNDQIKIGDVILTFLPMG